MTEQTNPNELVYTLGKSPTTISLSNRVPQRIAKQIAYPTERFQMKKKGVLSCIHWGDLPYFQINSIGSQRDN